MIFLISALFLIALSIPLYFKKMTTLIAGYNTMSFKEKNLYNQKKLCLITAITLDGAAFICLFGYFSLLSWNDTVILCITELLIGVILGNILSKKNTV